MYFIELLQRFLPICTLVANALNLCKMVNTVEHQ